MRLKEFKNYPFWRIDKFQSQIIYGGWHFSFLNSPEEIANKIKSFSHGEFNQEDFIDTNNIAKRILNKEDIFERGYKLKKVDIDESFPEYILKNTSLLKDWIV